MLKFSVPRSADAKSRSKAKPRATHATTPDGFWHQPAALNLVADMLIVFASILLTWAGVAALQRLPFFPLRELTVSSNLNHVQQAQLEQAARSSISGNIFTVDLDEARAAMEKLPWVRRVDLRRQWPDSLDLRVEEHNAVAQWRQPDGELRLVNSYGEVFSAEPMARLPIFSGPEGSSADVLARFKEFQQTLTAIDRQPVSIVLTQRQSWQVRLDNGLVVDLGRDQGKNTLSERMARFTENYRDVAARAQMTVAVVDMRYPNGFTLRPAHSDKGNT